MRSTHLHLLFTPEGLIIAAVTLVLTLIICRPRRPVARAEQKVAPADMSLTDQFRASMGMNHQRWHDGIGYDLSLLSKATPEELAEIEALLLHEPVSDWRIVEGLSRMRTPATIARLKSALATSRDHAVKMAITQYAADLISIEERSAAIMAALREAPLIQGFHRAVQQIPDFHPREVMDELHLAVLKREGEVAIHGAALLLFLHGKASSIFASAHRTFLTRFVSKNADERISAYRELCEIIEFKPRSA